MFLFIVLENVFKLALNPPLPLDLQATLCRAAYDREIELMSRLLDLAGTSNVAFEVRRAYESKLFNIFCIKKFTIFPDFKVYRTYQHLSSLRQWNPFSEQLSTFLKNNLITITSVL